MAGFSPELWEEARRLVVEEGRTYRDVADATGISHSAIEKRAARERWQQRRDSSMAYEDQARMLKANLLKHANRLAEDSKADATELYKAVQCWKMAEAQFPERRSRPQSDPQLRLEVALELLGELVNWLATEAPQALRVLQPFIRPFSEHLRRGLNAA